MVKVGLGRLLGFHAKLNGKLIRLEDKDKVAVLRKPRPLISQSRDIRKTAWFWKWRCDDCG